MDIDASVSGGGHQDGGAREAEAGHVTPVLQEGVVLHHLAAAAPGPHHLATLHPVDARSHALLWLEQRQGAFRIITKNLPSSSCSFQTVSFL